MKIKLRFIWDNDMFDKIYMKDILNEVNLTDANWNFILKIEGNSYLSLKNKTTGNKEIATIAC